MWAVVLELNANGGIKVKWRLNVAVPATVTGTTPCVGMYTMADAMHGRWTGVYGNSVISTQLSCELTITMRNAVHQQKERSRAEEADWVRK